MLKKSLSLVLSASLIWSAGGGVEAVAAAPALFALPSDLPQFRLQPPARLGRVIDYFNADKPSNQLVVIIQDLHAHYGVQKNIAGLLKFLEEKLKDQKSLSPKLPFAVGVEGAWQPVDNSILAKFPDRQIALKAADFLTKEAELTGAELYAVEKQMPFLLQGVEDKKLYLQHRDVFRKTFQDRQDLITRLKQIQAELRALPDETTFPKSVRSIKARVRASDEGRMPMLDFINYLVSHPAMDRKQLKKDFPALSRFASNAAVSVSMDQTRASTRAFLSKTQTRFSAEEKKNLEVLAKSADNQPYFLYLRELVYKHQLFGAISPELAQHLEFVHTLSTAGMVRVFFEAKELAFRLQLTLAKEQPVRNLLQVEHDLDLLLRVTQLKATENEVRSFIPRFDGFLEMTRVLMKGKTDSLPLQKLISSSIDYYVLAMLRNKPMVDKTLALPSDTRVVVMGGFHSAPVTHILRERNVSYVVLTPDIDRLDGPFEQLYIDRLMGKHLSPADIRAKIKAKASEKGQLSRFFSRDRADVLQSGFDAASRPRQFVTSLLSLGGSLEQLGRAGVPDVLVPEVFLPVQGQPQFVSAFTQLEERAHQEGIAHKPAIAAILARFRQFGDGKDYSQMAMQLLSIDATDIIRELVASDRITAGKLKVILDENVEGKPIRVVAGLHLNPQDLSAAYTNLIIRGSSDRSVDGLGGPGSVPPVQPVRGVNNNPRNPETPTTPDQVGLNNPDLVQENAARQALLDTDLSSVHLGKWLTTLEDLKNQSFAARLWRESGAENITQFYDWAVQKTGRQSDWVAFVHALVRGTLTYKEDAFDSRQLSHFSVEANCMVGSALMVHYLSMMGVEASLVEALQNSQGRYINHMAVQVDGRRVDWTQPSSDDPGFQHFRPITWVQALHMRDAFGATSLLDKKPAAALKELQRVAEQMPDWAVVHNMLGVAYRRVNDLQSAFKAYAESDRLNPNSPALMRNIALLYLETKKWSLAAEYLKKYRALDPENFDLVTQLDAAEKNAATPLPTGRKWWHFFVPGIGMVVAAALSAQMVNAYDLSIKMVSHVPASVVEGARGLIVTPASDKIVSLSLKEGGQLGAALREFFPQGQLWGTGGIYERFVDIAGLQTTPLAHQSISFDVDVIRAKLFGATHLLNDAPGVVPVHKAALSFDESWYSWINNLQTETIFLGVFLVIAATAVALAPRAYQWAADNSEKEFSLSTFFSDQKTVVKPAVIIPMRSPGGSRLQRSLAAKAAHIASVGILAALFAPVAQAYEVVANGMIRVTAGDTLGQIVKDFAPTAIPRWGANGSVQRVWDAWDQGVTRTFGDIRVGDLLPDMGALLNPLPGILGRSSELVYRGVPKPDLPVINEVSLLDFSVGLTDILQFVQSQGVFVLAGTILLSGALALFLRAKPKPARFEDVLAEWDRQSLKTPRFEDVLAQWSQQSRAKDRSVYSRQGVSRASGQLSHPNEDRYVQQTIHIPDLRNGQGRFYAVMDGSGGSQTSERARASLTDSNHFEGYFSQELRRANGDISVALAETVQRLVEESREDESSSTVAIVYVPENAPVAHVATLGDSRIYIRKAGGGIWKSAQQNVPDLMMNRERREQFEADHARHLSGPDAHFINLYGKFTYWKTMPVINVHSRNLQKPDDELALTHVLGAKKFDPILSREPEIVQVPLDAGSLIVVASDGVKDRWENSVADLFAAIDQGRSMEEIARGAAAATDDDITVMAGRPSPQAVEFSGNRYPVFGNKNLFEIGKELTAKGHSVAGGQRHTAVSGKEIILEVDWQQDAGLKTYFEEKVLPAVNAVRQNFSGHSVELERAVAERVWGVLSLVQLPSVSTLAAGSTVLLGQDLSRGQVLDRGLLTAAVLEKLTALDILKGQTYMVSGLNRSYAVYEPGNNNSWIIDVIPTGVPESIPGIQTPNAVYSVTEHVKRPYHKDLQNLARGPTGVNPITAIAGLAIAAFALDAYLFSSGLSVVPGQALASTSLIGIFSLLAYLLTLVFPGMLATVITPEDENERSSREFSDTVTQLAAALRTQTSLEPSDVALALITDLNSRLEAGVVPRPEHLTEFRALITQAQTPVGLTHTYTQAIDAYTRNPSPDAFRSLFRGAREAFSRYVGVSLMRVWPDQAVAYLETLRANPSLLRDVPLLPQLPGVKDSVEMGVVDPAVVVEALENGILSKIANDALLQSSRSTLGSEMQRIYRDQLTAWQEKSELPWPTDVSETSYFGAIQTVVAARTGLQLTLRQSKGVAASFIQELDTIRKRSRVGETRTEKFRNYVTLAMSTARSISVLAVTPKATDMARRSGMLIETAFQQNLHRSPSAVEMDVLADRAGDGTAIQTVLKKYIQELVNGSFIIELDDVDPMFFQITVDADHLVLQATSPGLSLAPSTLRFELDYRNDPTRAMTYTLFGTDVESVQKPALRAVIQRLESTGATHKRLDGLSRLPHGTGELYEYMSRIHLILVRTPSGKYLIGDAESKVGTYALNWIGAVQKKSGRLSPVLLDNGNLSNFHALQIEQNPTLTLPNTYLAGMIFYRLGWGRFMEWFRSPTRRVMIEQDLRNQLQYTGSLKGNGFADHLAVRFPHIKQKIEVYFAPIYETFLFLDPHFLEMHGRVHLSQRIAYAGSLLGMGTAGVVVASALSSLWLKSPADSVFWFMGTSIGILILSALSAVVVEWIVHSLYNRWATRPLTLSGAALPDVSVSLADQIAQTANGHPAEMKDLQVVMEKYVREVLQLLSGFNPSELEPADRALSLVNAPAIAQKLALKNLDPKGRQLLTATDSPKLIEAYLSALGIGRSNASVARQNAVEKKPLLNAFFSQVNNQVENKRATIAREWIHQINQLPNRAIYLAAVKQGLNYIARISAENPQYKQDFSVDDLTNPSLSAGRIAVRNEWAVERGIPLDEKRLVALIRMISNDRFEMADASLPSVTRKTQANTTTLVVFRERFQGVLQNFEFLLAHMTDLTEAEKSRINAAGQNSGTEADDVARQKADSAFADRLAAGGLSPRSMTDEEWQSAVARVARDRILSVPTGLTLTAAAVSIAAALVAKKKESSETPKAEPVAKPAGPTLEERQAAVRSVLAQNLAALSFSEVELDHLAVAADTFVLNAVGGKTAALNSFVAGVQHLFDAVKALPEGTYKPSVVVLAGKLSPTSQDLKAVAQAAVLKRVTEEANRHKLSALTSLKNALGREPDQDEIRDYFAGLRYDPKVNYTDQAAAFVAKPSAPTPAPSAPKAPVPPTPSPVVAPAPSAPSTPPVSSGNDVKSMVVAEIAAQFTPANGWFSLSKPGPGKNGQETPVDVWIAENPKATVGVVRQYVMEKLLKSRLDMVISGKWGLTAQQTALTNEIKARTSARKYTAELTMEEKRLFAAYVRKEFKDPALIVSIFLDRFFDASQRPALKAELQSIMDYRPGSTNSFALMPFGFAPVLKLFGFSADLPGQDVLTQLQPVDWTPDQWVARLVSVAAAAAISWLLYEVTRLIQRARAQYHAKQAAAQSDMDAAANASGHFGSNNFRSTIGISHEALAILASA